VNEASDDDDDDVSESDVVAGRESERERDTEGHGVFVVRPVVSATLPRLAHASRLGKQRPSDARFP
jgi:hypothetical protein